MLASDAAAESDGEACEADTLSIWTLLSSEKKKYRMKIPDTVLYTDSLLATWFYFEEGEVCTRLIDTSNWMVSYLKIFFEFTNQFSCLNS